MEHESVQSAKRSDKCAGLDCSEDWIVFGKINFDLSSLKNRGYIRPIKTDNFYYRHLIRNWPGTDAIILEKIKWARKRPSSCFNCIHFVQIGLTHNGSLQGFPKMATQS
jgi:hypothetical protein